MIRISILVLSGSLPGLDSGGCPQASIPIGRPVTFPNPPARPSHTWDPPTMGPQGGEDAMNPSLHQATFPRAARMGLGRDIP